MFSVHLTHSASSTASIIFSKDICDSATSQDKAGESMTLKISELLLVQSDSSNSSLELPFQ